MHKSFIVGYSNVAVDSLRMKDKHDAKRAIHKALRYAPQYEKLVEVKKDIRNNNVGQAKVDLKIMKKDIY